LHPSTLAKRGTVLLFLAFIAFYLYGLGHLPLVGPDEPRYAQVAREMLLRHDLITPTLGGHLWFEKPALLYWLMIVSFKLFGVSEWSARLGPALSGLLTIAAVWWIGKRVETASLDLEPTALSELRGLSFWSTLVAGTSAGIIIFSRAASFDIVVTMTTVWALAFFIVAELEEDARRRLRLLAGFYIFVGVSLLAKGLVGIVIPFGVAGAYYVLRAKAPERNIVVSLLWGLPLSLLVAATWYGPVIWKHGWPFINQFFVQHHFARFLTDKYHHPAPAYYYLLIFIALTLPWSAFVIAGMVNAGKRLWPRDDVLRTDPRNKFRVFTIAWVLLPLIFFSLSSSKLPGYILPVFPAAALIAGERLSRLNFHPENHKWTLRITCALCLIFAAGVIVYAERSGNLSTLCAALIAAPFAAAGGFGLVFSKRGSLAVIMIGGATLAGVLIVLNCGAPKLAERESTKHLLELADARGYSDAFVYGLQRDDRTPEFYAAGRVAYDADGEATKYDGVGQIVWESRKRRAPILVMAPLDEVNQFTQLSSVRVDVIGNNGKIALVAVAPAQ
jgi:4-amino-4-deoxy-L-arabinose transferase-like glycosyltransferase